MPNLVEVNRLGLCPIVLERILRSSVSVQLIPEIVQGFEWLRLVEPPVTGSRVMFWKSGLLKASLFRGRCQS